MPARWQFTPEQELRMMGPESNAALAREFGCTDMPIRRYRARHGRSAQPAAAVTEAGTMTTKDGVTTASSGAVQGGLETIGDVEAYLRKRWGLAADVWAVLSVTVNEWQGPIAGGGSATFAQAKGSFVKRQDIAALLPAPAAWSGPRYPARKRGLVRKTAAMRRIVALYDHQAPYINDALHRATLAMIRDLKPDELAHGGDLADYTNISKHKDHAYIKADVDECTQAATDILASLRAAAPDARFRLLEGNHDIRPLSEMLLRCERMANIRGGDLHDGKGRDELITTRKLWRLDELGIELVADQRGWQHAELELVPGPAGLVMIHGHLTGRNVAARTLEDVGRSVILGHTHRPEHVFHWNKSLRVEQQAMVAGCQCAVRGDKGFPTFVARDKWLQGPVVVTVHADGQFVLERVRWTGDSLVLGSKRWSS